jgi:hypothetical protein
MLCQKCSSQNIQIVTETTGKVHGGSFMQSLGRLFLILCTCGLWLLVPKGRGKIKSKTKAVCINCGNQWYI